MLFLIFAWNGLIFRRINRACFLQTFAKRVRFEDLGLAQLAVSHKDEQHKIFCIGSIYRDRGEALSNWMATETAKASEPRRDDGLAGLRGTPRALTQISMLHNKKALCLCPLLRSEAMALLQGANRILPFSYALIPKSMALIARIDPSVADLLAAATMRAHHGHVQSILSFVAAFDEVVSGNKTEIWVRIWHTR